MDAKTLAKIEAAVAACLAQSHDPARPYTSVNKFIEGLKNDPTWCEPEITEVRTRVIRALLGPKNGGAPPSS